MGAANRWALDERDNIEAIDNIQEVVTDLFGFRKIIPKTLFRNYPCGRLVVTEERFEGLPVYENQKGGMSDD